MPDPKPQFSVDDDAIALVLSTTAVQIANAANTLQLEIDAFMREMGVSMSREEIIAMIENSDTSVARAALDKFRNAVKSSLALSINQAGNAGYEGYLRENDTGKMYVWVTSGHSCPDCSEREGVEHTMEEWDAYGQPKSGFSICGHNCKCHLEEVV